MSEQERGVTIDSDLVVEKYLGASIIGESLSILVATEEGNVEILFPLDDLTRRVAAILLPSPPFTMGSGEAHYNGPPYQAWNAPAASSGDVAGTPPTVVERSRPACAGNPDRDRGVEGSHTDA